MRGEELMIECQDYITGGFPGIVNEHTGHAAKSQIPHLRVGHIEELRAARFVIHIVHKSRHVVR